MAPPSQSLPSKEHALFRQIVKYYETKQYKKGLKSADAVLKRFPEHGETLAMKGLICNGLEKKEEAYELVRKGLKFDLKSHVCWHVYGLLYRSDRNYREAIKCYRNALRLDKENSQILRDLSLLQVQMRDREGYVETRRQLLTMKPSNRNNWIAFAISHHVNGSHEMAASVLDRYAGTIEAVPLGEQYEHSEMLMYKAMILEEGGMLEKAVEHLDASSGAVVDVLGARHQKGRMLLALGRNGEAEEVFRRLLKVNPDNYEYHEGLRASLSLGAEPLDAAGRDRLEGVYDELAELHPRSSACARLPLDFLAGDKFERRLAQYVRKPLRKGVPSLFSDLKPLYADGDKSKALDRVVVGVVDELRAKGRFPELPGGEDPAPAEGSEDPATLMWGLLLLCQHHSHLERTAEALRAVDESIAHTPTVVDLYLAKSRILKRAGDLKGAALLADEGRSLDLADRYLNGFAVKKLMRAGRVADAEKTASLFTKDGDQANNLHDMQCMWYELESGAAYERRGDLGMALKNYLYISKHFEDFAEDMFDFHTYCVRKMTLRAYVKMLRVQDTLKGHAYFRRGASAAARVYLALHDRPSAAEEEEANEAALAALPPAERKKMKQKLRKAAQKKQKEEEERAAAAAAAREAEEKEAKERAKSGKPAGPPREKDPDPDGSGLLKTEDPLGEAKKLVDALLEHAGGWEESHLLAFEVARRKGKHLLALRAVKKALKLDPGSAPAHRNAVLFLVATRALPEGTPAAVRDVVASESKALTGGASAADFHAAFVKRARTLPERCAAAEGLLALGAGAPEARKALLGGGVPAGAKLGEALEVERVAAEVLKDPSAAEEWRAAAAAAFPFSEHFEGGEWKALEEKRAAEAKAEAEAPVV